MDLQEVESKLAELQARFNEAQTKKNAADEDVKTYDAELYRMQGEFRVLNQVKDVLAAAPAPADPAVTVKAEAKKNG